MFLPQPSPSLSSSPHSSPVAEPAPCLSPPDLLVLPHVSTEEVTVYLSSPPPLSPPTQTRQPLASISGSEHCKYSLPVPPRKLKRLNNIPIYVELLSNSVEEHRTQKVSYDKKLSLLNHFNCLSFAAFLLPLSWNLKSQERGMSVTNLLVLRSTSSTTYRKTSCSLQKFKSGARPLSFYRRLNIWKWQVEWNKVRKMRRANSQGEHLNAAGATFQQLAGDENGRSGTAT